MKIGSIQNLQIAFKGKKEKLVDPMKNPAPYFANSTIKAGYLIIPNNDTFKRSGKKEDSEKI